MTSGRVAPEPDVVDAKCRDILERFGYDRGRAGALSRNQVSGPNFKPRKFVH